MVEWNMALKGSRIIQKFPTTTLDSILFKSDYAVIDFQYPVNPDNLHR